jgi:hypothetical protein
LVKLRSIALVRKIGVLIEVTVSTPRNLLELTVLLVILV